MASITRSIYIFYGFSGNKHAPGFPNGRDKDRSLELVAKTLKDTLASLYPSDDIQVVQSWTKDILIDTLENSANKIRQVHIACHGDAGMLSLAYYYDNLKRLKKRAVKFNKMKGTDKQKAIAAMKDEDAIVAGFFANALDKTRLGTIKKNHLANAAWQIWGCYSGYPDTTFDGIGSPEIDQYLKRFNLGKTQVPGVAVDIAKTLGVTCTAAKGGSGMNFWHGEKGGKVLENNRRVKAQKPFWLWNTTGSTWVTYGPSGAEKPKPLIFQKPRDPKDLPTPKPPKWLTDPGMKAVGFAKGKTKPPETKVGQVETKWFDSDAGAKIVYEQGFDEKGEFSSNAFTAGFEFGEAFGKVTLPSYVKLRSEWNAVSTSNCGSPHTPKEITIHHTASTIRKGHTAKSHIKGIQTYHRTKKPKGPQWCDIAYHFIISPDGQIWQGREDVQRTGSHVKNKNTGRIGVCFIGNFQKSAVPEAMITGVAPLIAWLGKTFNIPLDRKHIKGHRELASTTVCPGDHLMTRLGDIIKAAKKAGKGEAKSLSTPPQKKSLPSFINPRSKWNAANTGVCGRAHSPQRITIHHTVSKILKNQTVENHIKGIQTYHRKPKPKGRGWCDIGYHYLISPDGRIWQGRENVERTGAHVLNQNTNNVGISFIGDFQKSDVPQAMLNGVATLIAWLSSQYNIPIDRDHIKGHKELAATLCPGDYLMAKLNDILKLASAAKVPESQGLEESETLWNSEVETEQMDFEQPGFNGSVSLEYGTRPMGSPPATPAEEFEYSPSEGVQIPTAFIRDFTEDVPSISDEEIEDKIGGSRKPKIGRAEDEVTGSGYKKRLVKEAEKYRDVKRPSLGEDSSEDGDDSTPRRHAHDVFDGISADLTHATSFNLGKHELNKRLEAFSQEIMEEGGGGFPVAGEKKTTEPPELDDMDYISSFAFIEDSGKKLAVKKGTEKDISANPEKRAAETSPKIIGTLVGQDDQNKEQPAAKPGKGEDETKPEPPDTDSLKAESENETAADPSMNAISQEAEK